MGSLHAMESSEMVQNGELSMKDALHYHLQYNHYPPVHPSFIAIAEKAIQLANDDQWNEVIDMPNGKSLRVGDIVSGLHLEHFLDQDDY